MAAFINNCGFVPTTGGTSDWTYFSTVGGYQGPIQANAVNGTVYVVRAQSADLTQWEYASGAYSSATNTFARATVLYNSAGTGTKQGGSGAKINFAAAPALIAVVALAEDLISIEAANSFTTAQQAQARSNIAAAATPGNWTRTVITSASGTYTTKAGCKAIFVRMCGGGGGSGGSSNSSGNGSSAGAGGNTTFGSMVANGGAGGSGSGGPTSNGGAYSGGDWGLSGSYGAASVGAGAGPQGAAIGGQGGGSFFGPGSPGGWPNAGGLPGVMPGAGAGGAGGPAAATGYSGGGGAGAGYTEKLIVSPAVSYSYAVGAGGGGGASGTSGNSGASGGSGIIVIDEYY
ncbi:MULTISPECIES: hypothetical protein [unclassified Bradyrhizobium]|uniref:hypothetical protein n=1 Tax=unclassified Bradyrhizobium TaxID=2631580 RepID=UPI0028EB7495|nr:MULTISPECIES: hypothetical protein [unclassified Bradyrhizobium]